ncbi:YdcH family protein [Dyella telluris]|uniref:YdcH family protein n=1 Tax=Dyella telluris TaxID=2763498 RepID=A0A7G8Q6W7_9GAMM|nr:YdcH family protein [Dyella telluris]QNK02525.1 YdcH family protein [Dyella telluris]
MFPEYRDLITTLKSRDPHFSRLFHRHNALDQEIANMETGQTPAGGLAIEQLKKEKLLLKDQMYVILRKASVS